VLIIPAIDLLRGRCVRLRQGDYARETVFNDDPVAVARHWVEQGAEQLHLVDLDGARDGKLTNIEAIRAIARAVTVPCQLGGGLRTEAHLQQAFALGIQRLVMGTRALKAPEWFSEMVRKHPGRLLLGLDAKNGRVATDGWLEVAECRAVDLARRFENLPLASIIYTDIQRDGMMQGPNLVALGEMVRATPLPVIASGGITTLEDIRQLTKLPLAGCIVGRALYEGTLNLAEAIRLGPQGLWS
jgi:phosphoribosylformimino-5-aminoimidazole carboxamide ribotide isomerase